MCPNEHKGNVVTFPGSAGGPPAGLSGSLKRSSVSFLREARRFFVRLFSSMKVHDGEPPSPAGEPPALPGILTVYRYSS
jgi:hypothetical protein